MRSKRRLWFAPLWAFMVMTACDGGDCAKAPNSDWTGTSDVGTSFGCECECDGVVSCFKLEGGCPTGRESVLAEGTVSVSVDGRDYQLTSVQVGELTDACEAAATGACDSGS